MASLPWRLLWLAKTRCAIAAYRNSARAPDSTSPVAGRGALEACTIFVGHASIVKPPATATFCGPFAVRRRRFAEVLAPEFLASGGIDRIEVTEEHDASGCRSRPKSAHGKILYVVSRQGIQSNPLYASCAGSAPVACARCVGSVVKAVRS